MTSLDGETDLAERFKRYPLQTALRHSPVLTCQALTAPHCATRTEETAGGEIHAVTMDSCLDAMRGTVAPFTGPCGVDDLILLAESLPDYPSKGPSPIAWPPRVAGLKPFTRCHTCWVLTGRKRPASHKQPLLTIHTAP